LNIYCCKFEGWNKKGKRLVPSIYLLLMNFIVLFVWVNFWFLSIFISLAWRLWNLFLEYFRTHKRLSNSNVIYVSPKDVCQDVKCLVSCYVYLKEKKIPLTVLIKVKTISCSRVYKWIGNAWQYKVNLLIYIPFLSL